MAPQSPMVFKSTPVLKGPENPGVVELRPRYPTLLGPRLTTKDREESQPPPHNPLTLENKFPITGKSTRWLSKTEVPTTKAEDLSPVSRTHTMEGENKLPQDVP